MDQKPEGSRSSGPHLKRSAEPELSRKARQNSSEPALRGGKAYTEKPDLRNEARDEDGGGEKRRRVKIAAVAAAVVLTAAGLFFASPIGQGWLHPGPQAEQTQAHTLIFTDKDLDVAATQKARDALRRGEVPPEVARLSEDERREILNGERAFFTERIVDEVNSLLYFHVNGAEVDWQLSEGTRTLTIALKKGQPALLRLTAARDSGDGSGVHVVMKTSAGPTLPATIPVGQTLDWTLLVK
jgi:hypothetical protein